jgi:hypothetical protein
LNEIVFSSGSHLKEIGAFCDCTSLSRIEIPSSIEVITFNGFLGCRSLKEIALSSDSHLRELDGLGYCTSLCRIEIPSSVEVIGHGGFARCPSLHVVIIRAGCRLSRKGGLQNVHAFVVYEDEYENMKHSRRQLHLGIGGRKM